MKSLERRLENLEKQARDDPAIQAIERQSRSCKGLSIDDIIDRILDACPAGAGPILCEIARQAVEYHAQPPPYRLHDGSAPPHRHGFLEWLDLLQRGDGLLPDRIPLVVLLAWQNGHANHPVPGATPVPIRRCESCLMILPNCTPDGSGPCLFPCPVCGSTRIGHADLARGGWLPLRHST